MRLTVSLVLATGAAGAFSFAVDVLLGSLIGLYPSTAFSPRRYLAGPFSAIFLLGAEAISGGNRWLACPYVVSSRLPIVEDGAPFFRTDQG